MYLEPMGIYKVWNSENERNAKKEGLMEEGDEEEKKEGRKEWKMEGNEKRKEYFLSSKHSLSAMRNGYVNE